MIHSLQIPRFVDPSDTQVFADRSDVLEGLVNQIVDAGNKLREGVQTATKTIVVSGTVGVGKSAVIFEALRAIREPERSPNSRRPTDPDRWLEVYVSCKTLSGIADLLNAIRSVVDSTADALIAQLDAPSRRLHYSVIDRLFGRSNYKEAIAVREALSALAVELSIARQYWGASVTETLTTQTIDELRREVELIFKAELSAKRGDEKSQAASAALSRVSKFALTQANKSSKTTTIEHRYTIGTDFLVEACNAFFEATRAVGVPVVLVLDDIDELLTDLGSDYAQRAKVLRALLGPLRALRPTALLFGVRREYVDFDVRRVASVVDIEPVRAKEALLILEAWTRLLNPNASDDEVRGVMDVAARVAPRVGPDDRAVVPLRFLEIVQYAVSNPHDGHDRAELIERYMRSQGLWSAGFTALREASTPYEQLCALRAEPVDFNAAHVSAITAGDREQLVRDGLVRPEHAVDGAVAPRVLFDPLFGYLYEPPSEGPR